MRLCGLRQIVAERGKDHVVDCRRREEGRRFCITIGARPSVPHSVGVLQSVLHPPLRSLVEPIPESERSLDDIADVTLTVRRCDHAARCIRACRRVLVHGRQFDTAAIVAEKRRTVADSLAVGVRVSCAPIVLATDIGVDIELGSRMKFQRSESLI